MSKKTQSAPKVSEQKSVDGKGPLPSWLDIPPTGTVQPPVRTRTQLLPLQDLAWEDFERLCVRLARLESSIEHCQLYGTRGQRQHGIDLYARRTRSSDYVVYQCKRVARFGPTALKAAVTAFRRGTWFNSAKEFIICTTTDGSQTRTAEELERQQKSLRKRGILVRLFDRSEVSRLLNDEPSIVDDFFGRAWTEAFCGADAVEGLGRRLDAGQVIEFRRRLRDFYGEVFNLHDPGIPIPPQPGTDSIPLRDRYVAPDVLASDVLPEATISAKPRDTVEPLKSDSPGSQVAARPTTTSSSDGTAKAFF